MHDIADLERRGIPGGYVATTEFVEAADAQAEALGYEPASLFVQHPVQDRTDEEIVALGEAAVEEALAMILA